MNIKTVSIFLIVISIIVLLVPIPGMYVTITERGGKTIVTHPVVPGDIVSLEFVHSVEKVRVIDTYLVTPGGELFLKNTTFGSTGYGLPTDASYNLTVNAEGDYVVEGINETYQSIALSTGPIPRHNVTIGVTTYPLYSMTGDGTHLILGIEANRPIYKCLINI